MDTTSVPPDSLYVSILNFEHRAGQFPLAGDFGAKSRATTAWAWPSNTSGFRQSPLIAGTLTIDTFDSASMTGHLEGSFIEASVSRGAEVKVQFFARHDRPLERIVFQTTACPRAAVWRAHR
jgi:hypothetical protein